MDRKTVIDPRCLPSRMPLHLTILGWLLLDRLGTRDLWFGVFWSVVVLAWAVWIWSIFEEKWEKLEGFGRKS